MVVEIIPFIALWIWIWIRLIFLFLKPPFDFLLNVNNNWTVDREEVDKQNRLWSNDPGSPARPGLPGDKKYIKYKDDGVEAAHIFVKMVFLPVQILPQ